MCDEKSEVKAEGEPHINLKVAGQDGSIVQFKIKRHTPLKKLMQAYCERQGLQMGTMRFRFDGQPINELDTPNKLDMENDDTIDVFQQQTGGQDALDREKLKRHLSITGEEADHILSIIWPYSFKSEHSIKILPKSCGVSEAYLSEAVSFKSVTHLLKTKLQDASHIVSFSSGVDKLLGGGFPVGKTTEIAGEAGSGKTQFCFQLCVDVQIPGSLGGVGAEAVFLDVERRFFPQRVKQIAKAAVQHCHHVAGSSEDKECVASLRDFTVENIMSHIYVFHCQNSAQLLAATYQMREFLQCHSKVKLMVIDSVAQCFRGEDDFRSRSKFLLTLGRILRDVAEELGLSVVFTNQVASKTADGGTECNVPALGLKWSHFASIKLMLRKIGLSRLMYQYKSPNSVDGMAEFGVCVAGVRNSCKNTELINNSAVCYTRIPGAFGANPMAFDQPADGLPDFVQGDNI